MKLPYPNTDKIPIVIKLSNGRMNENGVPIILKEINTKCTLSEKQLFVRDQDGKLIRLESKVYIKGDIAPDINYLEGEVILFGKEYKIYKSSRPRQPNGIVYHTKLELI